MPPSRAAKGSAGAAIRSLERPSQQLPGARPQKKPRLRLRPRTHVHPDHQGQLLDPQRLVEQRGHAGKKRQERPSRRGKEGHQRGLFFLRGDVNRLDLFHRPWRSVLRDTGQHAAEASFPWPIRSATPQRLPHPRGRRRCASLPAARSFLLAACITKNYQSENQIALDRCRSIFL